MGPGATDVSKRFSEVFALTWKRGTLRLTLEPRRSFGSFHYRVTRSSSLGGDPSQGMLRCAVMWDGQCTELGASATVGTCTGGGVGWTSGNVGWEGPSKATKPQESRQSWKMEKGGGAASQVVLLERQGLWPLRRGQGSSFS